MVYRFLQLEKKKKKKKKKKKNDGRSVGIQMLI
jgi:hypothetical protein